MTDHVTNSFEHPPGSHRLRRAAGSGGFEEAGPSLPAGPCVWRREKEEGLQELVSADRGRVGHAARGIAVL